MKIEYKGQTLNAERYGVEDVILNNGTILNINDIVVLEEYDDYFKDIAAKLFIDMIVKELSPSGDIIKNVAKRAIKYTKSFIKELENAN